MEGVPLGSMAQASYRERQTTLDRGDSVLLMSDGFPELTNEELIGGAAQQGQGPGIFRNRDRLSAIGIWYRIANICLHCRIVNHLHRFGMAGSAGGMANSISSPDLTLEFGSSIVRPASRAWPSLISALTLDFTITSASSILSANLGRIPVALNFPCTLPSESMPSLWKTKISCWMILVVKAI